MLAGRCSAATKLEMVGDARELLRSCGAGVGLVMVIRAHPPILSLACVRGSKDGHRQNSQGLNGGSHRGPGFDGAKRRVKTPSVSAEGQFEYRHIYLSKM